MKYFLLSFLLLYFTVGAIAQELVVERPPFSVRESRYGEIEKVVINDTATILHMVGIHYPHWWISVNDKVRLRAGGKIYPVKYAENIEFGVETYTNDDGEHPYRLVFDPIPLDTEQFDYFNEEGIGIYGVELKSPVLTNREVLPNEAKAALEIKDDGKPLSAPVFEEGKATLKGHFLGYRPEMNYEIYVYVDNPISGVQESYDIELSESGEFERQIPLPTTLSVLFRISHGTNHMVYNDYIVLSPNEETTVYFDLQQKACQESLFRRDKCEESQYMVFTGANAEINNQMNRKEVIELSEAYMNNEQLMTDIVGMTASQYKDYVLQKTDEVVSKIPELNLTHKAAQYLELKLQYHQMYLLMFIEGRLMSAYRRANNLNYEDKLGDYERPVLDKEYFSFLKDSSINNSISLYINTFGTIVSTCNYVNRERLDYSLTYEKVLDKLKNTENLIEDENAIIDYIIQDLIHNWKEDRIEFEKINVQNNLQKLIETGKLSASQVENVNNIKKFCQDKTNSILEIVQAKNTLIYTLVNNNIISFEEISDLQSGELWKSDPVQDEKVSAFWEKYKDKIEFLQKSEERNNRNRYLADIIGKDTGILFDLLSTQDYGQKFEEALPLEEIELNEISKLSNPFYYKYITGKNNELIAKIEENKNKKGYNVYEIRETEDDMILHEIMKPFEGKVVLIDFWETWCGPCRSAMKDFEATKKSFKDKDVVFIYLASESSPQKAWENMIPDIEGEHYRLKKNQMEYLEKKFGISGIPSYLILNKQGEQVYFRTGFEGSVNMANLLNKELEL